MSNPSVRRNATRLDSPPGAAPPLLRVSILAELPALLREMGQDPDRLFGELGLEPRLFADPENHIPFRAVGNLLRHCVIRTGCAHLGLLLGQRGGAVTLGQIGLLVRNSPDVGSALRGLISHLHHHDQGAVPGLTVEGGTALLSYAIYEPEVPASDQIYAAAMAITLRIMQELCGPHWRPSKVWLPFRKPRDTAPFVSFFRTRLRFDTAQGALAFPASCLKQTLRNTDHEIRQRIETLLDNREPTALVTRVRRALRAMLASPQLSEEDLARRLCMSRRTLIRQLKQEGTSFHILLRDVRSDAACVMLRHTDSPVEHIATELGYASASSFTRAFRHWTGQTPAAWRRLNAAGTPDD